MKSPLRHMSLGKAFDKLLLVKTEIRDTSRRHAQDRDMTKTKEHNIRLGRDY